MEKPVIIPKCNILFWFVSLVSFLILWFLLFCCLSLSLFKSNDGVTFFTNYAKSVIFQESSSCNLLLLKNTAVCEKNTSENSSKQPSSSKPVLDSCSGRYIYVHDDLPVRFNKDLLNNCSSLVKWFDLCQSVSNMGLGPPAVDSQGILQNKSWFATNQFLLEVIFHNRMKQYKCLTNDSLLASAIYVPFYAGLDIGRYLWGFNTSVRDSTSLDLVKWLTEKPEWRHLWGRDHFFVAGRVTWDFRRQTNNDSDWGNNLFSLPEAKNMTVLIIESSPRKSNNIDGEFAIPYPTYFHPSSDMEVIQWQKKLVRRKKRRYLFSFVGGPRPNLEDSIRGQIINQCLTSSEKCKFLDCSSNANKCDNPVYVMEMFRSSTFCLQPPGDSFTRRSTFDSILAGCIPVFFHPESAFNQYVWHLPNNYSKYSVFIPENDIKDGKANIEKTLSEISTEQVLEMRKEVVRLIPKVVYANPMSRMETLEDAFDIAIKKVLEIVETIRKEMKGPGKLGNSKVQVADS